MRRCSFALPVVLLAGCRGDQPPAPVSRGAAEWRLEALADISPADDSAFTRLVSIAADRDGNIYAADRGTSQIRVFDSLGAPVSVIGRPGRGPGVPGDLLTRMGRRHSGCARSR